MTRNLPPCLCSFIDNVLFALTALITGFQQFGHIVAWHGLLYVRPTESPLSFLNQWVYRFCKFWSFLPFFQIFFLCPLLFEDSSYILVRSLLVALQVTDAMFFFFHLQSSLFASLFQILSIYISSNSLIFYFDVSDLSLIFYSFHFSLTIFFFISESFI